MLKPFGLVPGIAKQNRKDISVFPKSYCLLIGRNEKDKQQQQKGNRKDHLNGYWNNGNRIWPEIYLNLFHLILWKIFLVSIPPLLFF
jgi:hypothetical protein